MIQYQTLLHRILHEGSRKEDRTGTGTISIFGHQMKFDFENGFPLITTKKVNLKAVIHELLWFIRGDTNIDYLNDRDIHIWDAWADDYGNLGPIYGKQWRSWDTPMYQIDQLQVAINEIKTNPDSRRIIVSAWNVGDLHKMKLPPCHCFFQFYVVDGKLSCQLYQRSADVFLGVPFNIASYALLTMMIAQVCGLKLGSFIHTLGDAHIYLNHMDQVRLQLKRTPYELPLMLLNQDVTKIDQFKYEDFALCNYECHPPIKGEISV